MKESTNIESPHTEGNLIQKELTFNMDDPWANESTLLVYSSESSDHLEYRYLLADNPEDGPTLTTVYNSWQGKNFAELKPTLSFFEQNKDKSLKPGVNKQLMLRGFKVQGTCTPVPMNSVLGCSDYNAGIDKRPLAFYLKYLPEDNPNVYDVDGLYTGELNLTGYNYQPFIKYKIKINLNTINFGLIGGEGFVTTSAKLVSNSGEYAMAKATAHYDLLMNAKKNPSYKNPGVSIMIQLPQLGHVGLIVDPPEFGSAVGPTELVEEIKGYTELKIPFARDGGNGPVMLKIRGTRSVKGCSDSYTINSTTTCNNIIGNYTYWKFEFYPEDNKDLPLGEYNKKLYLIAKDRDVNWREEIIIDISATKKAPETNDGEGSELPPDITPK